MEVKKIDRRVRKTKRQLREALMELLLEKPIQKITVREISDRVDINRGTFYLHYRDVFDMLEKVEKEMYEELEELINSYTIIDKQQSVPVLRPLFEYFINNSKSAIALIGPNGDRAFIIKLRELLHNKCLNDFIKNHPVANPKIKQYFDYYYSYIVLGCLGLMESWVENGMKETPEEMEILAEQIISSTVSSFNELPISE